MLSYPALFNYPYYVHLGAGIRLEVWKYICIWKPTTLMVLVTRFSEQSKHCSLLLLMQCQWERKGNVHIETRKRHMEFMRRGSLGTPGKNEKAESNTWYTVYTEVRPTGKGKCERE